MRDARAKSAVHASLTTITRHASGNVFFTRVQRDSRIRDSDHVRARCVPKFPMRDTTRRHRFHASLTTTSGSRGNAFFTSARRESFMRDSDWVRARAVLVFLHWDDAARLPLQPSLIPQETTVSKLVPNLWFAHDAEEAARFYASLLPNSHVDSVATMPAESPSGPANSLKIVEFTLMGQPYMAFGPGAFEPLNHAISLAVYCDDQAEIDRLWAALSEGGKVEQCGWLRDRYGLSWQIVPSVLGKLMKDTDRAKAKRAAQAMMKMVKFDIAELTRAFEGRESS
jgi:predicted 3-demethylubiquinone-9 3-methyltransferase (glyoxalase superfamily)